MKRVIVASAALLASVLCAQAEHSLDNYHDLRPNGHKRSEATFEADVASCKRLTHDSIYRPDSRAMKRCMMRRSWQWQSSQWVEDPPEQPSSNSTVDWTDFLKWEQ
jgi:hypothetical protein